jgi:hypothetical protein
MKKVNCRSFISVFYIILFFIISNNNIYASRLAPKIPEPIVYNNIKYSAEHGRDKSGNWVGYIQALNNKTEKTIWKQKLYTIKIKGNIEEDVQWVFINKLSIKGGLLIAQNEKGNTYFLNIITGESYNLYTLSCLIIFLSVLIAFYIYYKRKKILVNYKYTLIK